MEHFWFNGNSSSTFEHARPFAGREGGPEMKLMILEDYARVSLTVGEHNENLGDEFRVKQGASEAPKRFK